MECYSPSSFKYIIYTCELCQFSTKNESKIKAHILNQHSDDTEDEETEDLDHMLDSLTLSNYTNILPRILRLRTFLIETLGYFTYINILEQHFQKFTLLKIPHPETFFNPLELRMLRSDGWKDSSNLPSLIYINTYIDISLVEHYKEGWKESYEKYNTPFNSNDFLYQFQTYMLCLCSIQEYWNTISPQTLIYCVRNQNLENPYSFYYLTDIPWSNKVVVDSETKLWKMDCRLDQLTHDFIMNITSYCIELFRKFYYDVYHHNDYVPEFRNRHQLLEYEGTQLIQHIWLMSNYKKFNLLLRTLVMKNTYTFGINDRFNLSSDDIIQRRSYSQMTDLYEDTYILKLFDNLEKVPEELQQMK